MERMETGTLDRSKRSQDDEGGKLGCFLLQRGRLKWRESGRGCATRPTERIDDPSTVAPVPRTEIVTCPLCRRDPNAHAYRPRSSSDERTDKRVPWRGSSGELSSTRVYTRACECPQVKHTRTGCFACTPMHEATRGATTV